MTFLCGGASATPPAPDIWPTAGGEGGRIIEVTTLADSGPGSLRDALTASGRRMIVFKVAGEIWLDDTILVRNPFVTVAGDTAPAPGISLMGDRGIRIRTHDVVLRHLRIRVGALDGGSDPQNRDAISIDGSEDRTEPAYNILVENCSLAWSVDELLQIWGAGNRDIAIRKSILAAALNRSIHPKGAHGMGLIVGPRTSRIVIERNLFAHNAGRNPVLHGGAEAVVANNLIYNPDFAAFHVYPEDGAGPTRAAVVGNVVIAGADTGGRLKMFGKGVNPGSEFYLLDNKAVGVTTFEAEEIPKGAASPPLAGEWPANLPKVEALPSDRVEEEVLASAGARPEARDELDVRIIAEVRSRTGQLRNWPDDKRLDPNFSAAR